jgi:hypothetical protein
VTSVSDRPTTTRCTCARCHAHDLGIRGPFTQKELIALHGGIVNEPTPVEYPPDIVALADVAEAARVAYEEATAVVLDRTLQLGKVAAGSEEGRTLRAALTDAEIVRGERRERHSKASGAYHAAANAHTQAKTMAAYLADLEAQAAAESDRKTAREAAVLSDDHRPRGRGSFLRRSQDRTVQ